jgi:hypothetical protein
LEAAQGTRGFRGTPVEKHCLAPRLVGAPEMLENEIMDCTVVRVSGEGRFFKKFISVLI